MLDTSLSADPRQPVLAADRAGTQPRKVLSGVTTSGSLTLGNYLGALRRFVADQRHTQASFFVADLHALTTDHDPGTLRQLTVETATL